MKPETGKSDKASSLKLQASSRGFTLIEAVVASSVFVFVVSSVVGVYLSILQLDSKTRAERTLQQNTRFIMEYLTKNVRNGSINFSRYPGGSTNGVTNLLWVTNNAGEDVLFQLNGQDLSYSTPLGTTNLNSPGVRVTKLLFLARPTGNPFTSSKTFNQQPHVTVVMELTTSYGQQANKSSTINVQTTLSTREYPSRQP